MLLSGSCRLCCAAFPKLIRRRSANVSGAVVRNHLVVPGASRATGIWLLTCAGVTAGAVAIGGLTRLTESGLSMTEWRLLRDLKLPNDSDGWKLQFAKYRSYPEYEYKTQVREMSLKEFKFIYFMEYAHRMVGRVVGLTFALPAIYLWTRGRFLRGMKVRSLVFGGLIGFQGFLGWYMVRSGLEVKAGEVPRVSPYRLAAHLGSALLLYAGFLYNGMTLLLPRLPLNDTCRRVRTLRGLSHPLMLIIFSTAMTGAFVAGLDAGLVYNTWPSMAGRIIPTDLWDDRLGWRNFFENPATAQFVHRRMAEVTIACVSAFFLLSRTGGARAALNSRARAAIVTMLVVALAQASLGIATLLHEVPVNLASTHQIGSLALLSSALWVANELKRWPVRLR